MPDNVPITAGTGTDIAADLIGGVYFQRTKIAQGIDGSNDGDVGKTNPLPVQAGQALTRGMSMAQINVSTSGNQQIVAADGSKTIKVYGWVWKVAGAIALKWRDNANTTDLHPALPFASNGDGMIMDCYGAPYFITAAGGSLHLNLSTSIAVTGWVLYSQE